MAAASMVINRQMAVQHSYPSPTSMTRFFPAGIRTHVSTAVVNALASWGCPQEQSQPPIYRKFLNHWPTQQHLPTVQVSMIPYHPPSFATPRSGWLAQFDFAIRGHTSRDGVWLVARQLSVQCRVVCRHVLGATGQTGKNLLNSQVSL